jgi:hypothetical protein
MQPRELRQSDIVDTQAASSEADSFLAHISTAVSAITLTRQIGANRK